MNDGSGRPLAVLLRSPRRLRIVLLLIAVLAAACQASSESGQEVFDFSEIAEGEPVVEAHPSGTSATIQVTTTIDAVCAVAFGDTADLGRLATDQDMGAAGHSDHEVVLGGLSPDTEWRAFL